MPRPKFWKLGPHEVVRVTVRDYWEANALRNALAAGGVQAVISGDRLFSEVADFPGGFTPVEVVLRKADHPRAQTILEELRKAPPPDESEPPHQAPES